MTILPILASLVASSQKFSSVTSSRLFILNWIEELISEPPPFLPKTVIFWDDGMVDGFWEKSIGHIVGMAMVFNNCTQPLLGNTIHCPNEILYLTMQSDLNSHANVNKVVSNLVLIPNNVGLANSFKNLPNLLLISFWTPCVEKLKIRIGIGKYYECKPWQKPQILWRLWTLSCHSRIYGKPNCIWHGSPEQNSVREAWNNPQCLISASRPRPQYCIVALPKHTRCFLNCSSQFSVA